MDPDPKKDEHDVWREPPPPPPFPDFPEIPQSLRDAARGKETRRSPLFGLAAGWAMATDFIVTVIASWLLGFGFDMWRNSSPWGSLIGLGIGFAYGMYRLVRQSQRQEREADRRKQGPR